MPLVAYRNFNFRDTTEAVINQANAILEEYAAQGYELTLRQLYYQFVARAIIPNSQKEYNKLGDIVSNGRLAGDIDWYHITDRTRYVRTGSWWEDPSGVIKSAASSYKLDIWQGQPEYVEVWVEKDALVGVVEQACRNFRLPFLSCRGYTSQSEMWRASQRIGREIEDGKSVTILHLGDHDPSGIDMTRDINDRISEFLTGDGFNGWDSEVFHVDRIALNMDQVEQYDPPPNPAKLTDSRGAGYVEKYGNQSWELDALEPRVLDDLIQASADALIDHTLMEEWRAREELERETLTACSDRWAEVVEFLA